MTKFTEIRMILMICLFTSLSYGQWQNNNPGFGIDYYSLTIPDSNEIWAAGSDKIIHSSDGGNSWEIQFQSGNDLYSIKFINNEFGWAVGNYIYFGRAYRTTNGGENWEQLNIPGYHLRAVEFLDYSNGWVAGFDEIQKTTNGGLDWTTVPSGTGKYLFDISFINNLEGWAVGGSPGSTDGGVIIKTVDGGNNWTINKDSIDSRLEGIFFSDQNYGWVVGGGNGPKILKTTDGGITWVEKTSPVYADFNSVEFVNSNIGWVVGSDGKIIHTVDGGETWEVQESGLLGYLLEIDMVDSLKGYICGFGDNILITYNGGITDVEKYEHSVNEYKLFENYPNPFNPTTKIKYSVPQSEIVIIKVYDVLGKEIKTLVNGYKQSGTNEIDFDASELASGIYFYRMISGNYLETKKMLLLR